MTVLVPSFGAVGDTGFDGLNQRWGGGVTAFSLVELVETNATLIGTVPTGWFR